VRPFRPVRSPPAGDGSPDAVQTRLQRRFRVGTLATGTAPAFDRPLAPRYGSGLLTLRLRSLCSRSMCFHTARLRRFHGLCLTRSLPAVPFPLRALSVFAGLGLLAGSSRRETRMRSGLRSSSLNPLGNCVERRFETTRRPDSARTRFLIAPRLSAPEFMSLDRS